MDKRDIVKEYQDFCFKEHLVESHSTASFFCETYLKKDTKVNSKRIAQVYQYIDTISKATLDKPKRFAVRVEETLGRTIIVEGAENIIDAITTVEKLYDDSKLILDADDFSGYEIFASPSTCFDNGIVPEEPSIDLNLFDRCKVVKSDSGETQIEFPA